MILSSLVRGLVGVFEEKSRGRDGNDETRMQLDEGSLESREIALERLMDVR